MALTTREEVISLLKTSKSANEWDRNCDQIKAANGNNYPRWWFAEVVMSGLAGRIAKTWGGDADIHIQILD